MPSKPIARIWAFLFTSAPAAAVTRVYNLRGLLNAVHSFNASSTAALAQIAQEGCKRWPFFGKAAHELYLDADIKVSQRKSNPQPLPGKELTEVGLACPQSCSVTSVAGFA